MVGGVLSLDITQEQARKTKDERDKLWSENHTLRRFLEDLFDKLIVFICCLWALTYLASVWWSWFVQQNKAQAVTIVLSLTIAHSSIGFHNYLKRKRKELTEKP